VLFPLQNSIKNATGFIVKPVTSHGGYIGIICVICVSYVL